METIDVPRKDWKRALDGFSAIHEGWLVSLDVYEPAWGTEPLLRRVPLLGVTAEPGTRDSSITIAAALDGSDHFAHTVDHPRHVRIQRTDAGAVVAMLIDAADGTATVLRVNTPSLPETVDDFALVH